MDKKFLKAWEHEGLVRVEAECLGRVYGTIDGGPPESARGSSDRREVWVLYVENSQKPNPWKGTVASELGIAKHTLDTYLDRAYKKREETYRTVQELGKPEAVE